MKRLLLPLLLIPLCALAEDEKVAYTCDNGSHIDISFSADISGRPQATLHFADEAVVLPQVPAASGALYRNGDIRLHTKGDDAIIEDGKSNLRRCLRGNAPPASAQSAPPAPQPVASNSFLEIAGTASYPSQIALPPGAILNIRIQAAGRTLVEQRYELDGIQGAIPFTATVDRDLIGKKARITITARIDAGSKTRLVGQAVHQTQKNKQVPPISIALKPSQHARIR